jgi:hypothetical protein
VTFAGDIARLVWTRCAPCHRPGQSAPFNLLDLEDCRRHAKEIAVVTSRRQMPPWLPEKGRYAFEAERSLTAQELGLLQQWIEDGMPEGDRGSLGRKPEWADGWSMGKPDLVVQMARPYVLPAEGRDVYRNFTVAVPTSDKRFVRGVEFRSGTPRVVHHAFIYLDSTRQSRREEEAQTEPGFPGLRPPDTAKMPNGQFLSYQPGKLPAFSRPGLGWTLAPGSDLVLQLHLTPSGKREEVQASVGFYFTDQAPTNTPFKLLLNSLTMVIPPGVSNYVVEDSFELPCDVSLMGVLPHAHYLAQSVEGTATLPTGERVSLLSIPHWDFRWQGDYPYREFVPLPRGTRLTMRWVYDNSADNPLNPNRPPRAMTYGPPTSDEMAELWFQALVPDAGDLARLQSAYASKSVAMFAGRARFLLDRNPEDPKGHFMQASVLLNRREGAAALAEFERALKAKPDYQEACFNIGLLDLQTKRPAAARAALLQAVRLDPNDGSAYGALGMAELALGHRTEGETALTRALDLNPGDRSARRALERARSQPRQ